MVNYPTILGLPQEDIDRQLYVGVLGLESRVKALENKPKPTPTQSGTVTVTCQRYDEGELLRVRGCGVFICTELPPSEQTVVAETESGGDGVATFDEPINYGDYFLFATDSTDTYTYTGELTVDGDETVTITLTEQ